MLCSYNQKPLIPNLTIADTFWKRSIGLMGRASLGTGQGLLLSPCGSIHTCFMRFPIDVIFIDAHNQVVQARKNVAPWRLVWGGWKAHAVIEVQSGWLPVLPRVGDKVELPRSLTGGSGYGRNTRVTRETINMRYAVIMAGGSGTRLWPMSREATPKQLLPFIQGKSLVQIASHRLEGLVPAAQRYICAANKQEALMRQALPELGANQFLGEPCARDTLNAVGFSAAILSKKDPDAVIAIFTADHIIEPVDQFLKIVDQGFRLAEERPHTLVTFGIAPTHAATGYGYLQLSTPIAGGASIVDQFKEKPATELAELYFKAGPSKYLWNSGMFVWRASTLLDCIRRYHPENHAGLMKIAAAWGTPLQQKVTEEIYPTLKKISVDFAVMEPASRDSTVQVAAVPMPLKWLDVGSWPSFALTCPMDEHQNATGEGKSLLMDSKGMLVASSDPKHLIVTVGCQNLMIIHTPEATLICPADQAERIKDVHRQVGANFGPGYV